MVPFDTESPFVTSGIRIGTAAITTRGLEAEDCVKIVEWIDQLVSDTENHALIEQVKGEVNSFMESFPLYQHNVV